MTGSPRKSLIGGDDYEYAFYVTNTAFSNKETARGYEKRGNCENYIKESNKNFQAEIPVRCRENHQDGEKHDYEACV